MVTLSTTLPEPVSVSPVKNWDEVKLRTFNKSKTIAHRDIFIKELQVDYYCGCPYARDKQVDLLSCDYKIYSNADRAHRMEWEHVVPAATYGHTLQCWNEGGRKNCEHESIAFNNFEGDIHNLRPVVGEVNGNRENYEYGVVSDDTFVTYGSCKFKVDSGSRSAEPPDNIKGDLARITLYIREKYNIPSTVDFVSLMHAWMTADPVDDREKLINAKIKAVQGDSNYYIEGVQQ